MRAHPDAYGLARASLNFVGALSLNLLSINTYSLARVRGPGQSLRLLSPWGLSSKGPSCLIGSFDSNGSGWLSMVASMAYTSRICG